MSEEKPRIVVIGAGPAGLMAALAAAEAGCAARICDAMPTFGRKFLMAGRSGLNITHFEPAERFTARYGEAAAWMGGMLEDFSPADTRAFCARLGVETFVGSSGRVFPVTMKASPVLRAWLARLSGLGVQFSPRTRLVDLAGDGAPIVESQGRRARLASQATILALGGASWPRLGADAGWTGILERRGIAVAPFRPANCGLEIAWSPAFLGKFEGQALKNARITYAGRTIAGEVLVTRRGLEGGPVYALASLIGGDLRAGGAAKIEIDLKPDLTEGALAERFARRRNKDSFANFLRKAAGFSPLAVALLRETDPMIAQRDPQALARHIKACALRLAAVAGLERAISSAGGISRAEIDENLMLRKIPGLFVAGEMLDWDAPTGGYLLQACFATGFRAGAQAAIYAKAANAGA
ncbi:MAG: NAD(P)/FAD-dependent oxidoreductase [Rhodoblastus sp.]